VPSEDSDSAGTDVNDIASENVADGIVSDVDASDTDAANSVGDEKHK
jgi:hypothetical protein